MKLRAQSVPTPALTQLQLSLLSPSDYLPEIQELLDEEEADLFAGGGGASEGIEQATGKPIAIAINHDPDAIGMHQANHPATTHYLSDVWEVDPLVVCRGRRIGLLHASPDCTHHSQALGGQPRTQEIRSLAWVIHRWAGKVKPRIISAENVELMQAWGALIAKRDPATGRVITLDRIRNPNTKRLEFRVADPGEQVPRHRQFLVPDKRKIGRSWQRFVQGLRNLGYVVQWRIINNADLGAHSTRERLYLIARCDGEPIVWPEFTHAKKPNGSRAAWRPAHECIDWSISGRSIFGRKRPLADATLRRVAVGMKRFVVDSPEPFIVNNMANNVPRPVGDPLAPVLTGGHKMLVAPSLMPLTHQGGDRNHTVADPLPTVTAAHRGEIALTAASLVPVTHSRDVAYDVAAPLRTITTAKGGETALAAATLIQVGYGERPGQAARVLDLAAPLGTVVAGGLKHAISSACLVQAGHGEGNGPTKRRSHGVNDVAGPIGTVTASGGGQSVASAFMVQANGGFCDINAKDLRSPVSTVTTSGSQQQLIAAHLTTLRQHSAGRDAFDPLATVSAGGEHHAAIEYHLSPEHQEGALRCAEFLLHHHPKGAEMRAAVHTVADLLALVTVMVKGVPHVIVDITLRMLVPRELFNAQDFPPTYIIDRTASGKVLTKTAQVRMCGNSVSPLPLRKIIEANYKPRKALRQAA